MDHAQATDRDTARLFIALWPGADVVRALRAWPGLAACDAGRTAPAGHVHLTLHFLGDVPRARLPDVQRALRVPFQPFELALRHCVPWRGGIIVVLPDELPLSLARLHAALGERLRQLALRTVARPFRPHVTLARHHAGPPSPPLQPLVRWPVDGFVLARSSPSPGRVYDVLHAYACDGTASAG